MRFWEEIQELSRGFCLMGQWLHVVVGLLLQEDKVFVAQRPADKSHAGWWEFPGGKVEANETPFAALCRELYEETSIQVECATPWLHVVPGGVSNPPPLKKGGADREQGGEISERENCCSNEQSGSLALPVFLDVWRIDAFQGTLQGAEGQLVQWIAIAELEKIALLPANRPIVEKLCGH